MLLLITACATTLELGDTADTDTDADADTDADTDADSDTDADTDTDTDVGWASFLDAREDALRALGVPILACVARDDNSHAAFDGCYDWHSAVHGHWALFALARMLDDDSYAAAAELQLTEEDVAIELQNIEADTLYEVPYGYAWFLLLAEERSRGGEDDLLPLGDAAAAILDAHIGDLGPGAAGATALADDYENLSWAVLNLWRWSVSQGDAELQARMEAAARDLLVPLDEECPLSEDIGDTDNFFPACLMRAHTILTVLPADEADAWLEGALPEDYPITPVTEIRTPHTSGLNFSRTWGMWSVYLSTGDEAWRDRVQEHIEWQLAHPEYWAENYDAYSHWVPQFGVYALALTWE